MTAQNVELTTTHTPRIPFITQHRQNRSGDP
jgi:hypothetical protein